MSRKLPLSKQLVRREESSPFFGRIVSADIACPRCDWTTRIGSFGGSKRRREGAQIRKTRGLTWNPRTCRFKCPKCELVIRLGILAHRVVERGGSPAAPEGTVPSYAEALSLRRELSRLRHQRDGVAEPNNAWAAEATPAIEKAGEKGVPEKGVLGRESTETLWADLYRTAERAVQFYMAEDEDIPNELNDLNKVLLMIAQRRLR